MRRSHLDIICDILRTLNDGATKPTRLLYKVNLPHELFKKYVADLIRAGLIKETTQKNTKVYAITMQGALYLREYEKFLKFSGTFGL